MQLHEAVKLLMEKAGAEAAVAAEAETDRRRTVWTGFIILI